MLVYAIGFSAMFLGNVLFLTRVWGYSILRAGLAISVGPLIVAVTAPMFGKLAGRIGQRRLLVPGGLVWAAGGAAAPRPRHRHARLRRRVPAVGHPAPRSASRCACRSSRRRRCRGCRRLSSAPGSAVCQAVRNLGSTFGVALVVAFTADAVPRRRPRRLPPRLVAARRLRRRRVAAGDPPRASGGRARRGRRAGGGPRPRLRWLLGRD